MVAQRIRLVSGHGRRQMAWRRAGIVPDAAAATLNNACNLAAFRPHRSGTSLARAVGRTQAARLSRAPDGGAEMSHVLATAVAVVLTVGAVPVAVGAIPGTSALQPTVRTDTQCRNTVDTASAAPLTIAQAGCCGRAGGVCGCRQGRAVCCDGRSSTTCACHRDDNRAAAPGGVAGEAGR